MSASNPGHPPIFEPHLIRFNSRHQPAEDVEYPPDFATPQAANTGGAVGECRANRHGYDFLVRALLLSIKHHVGNDAFIMPAGILGDREWDNAIDLSSRTFPDRAIPALVGWPVTCGATWTR